MNENKEYLLESDFTEAEIKAYDSDLEDFDLDDFSKNLEEQIELDMQALGDLEESSKIFKSSESVLETIAQSVSDQFNSRIAAMAGENFIEDNNGLTLDLRKEAHIQTENFDSGKVATHNVYVDYEKRKKENYDNRYKKDAEGNVITNKKGKPILNRENFDDKKMRGEGKDGIEKDHTVSIKETANDGDELTYFDNNELKERINGETNIADMKASHNKSKNDKSTTEWLDGMSEKEKRERGITPELEKKYRDDDKKSREYRKKTLEQRKKEEEKLGEKSRKEETKKIGKATLKAVLFKLLKNLGEELLKNIIAWFKSAQKTLKTLLETIKTSIKNFIFDFKKNLKDAVSTSFNTIMTSIYGPIYRLVMSSWNLFKQGFTAVKKVYQYLKNEENKNKSSEEIMVGISEIILTTVSGAGAIVLGEFFEKKLMLIPGFAIEIPFLGSIASIIGIFLGAIISGVLGALVINRIKQYINKRLERGNTGEQLELLDRVRKNQEIDLEIKKLTLEETQYSAYENIHVRHGVAKEEIKEGLGKIKENLKSDETIDENLNEIDRLLGNI